MFRHRFAWASFGFPLNLKSYKIIHKFNLTYKLGFRYNYPYTDILY